MEPQLNLFHEDIYAAINTTVMALGGAKSVGSKLWPEKTPDKAGELLNNCLNRTRQEKLDPEQVLFISREGQKVGCHAIADFTGQDTGYQFTPIEPKDELAELYKQYINSTKTLQSLGERINRLHVGAVND